MIHTEKGGMDDLPECGGGGEKQTQQRGKKKSR